MTIPTPLDTATAGYRQVPPDWMPASQVRALVETDPDQAWQVFMEAVQTACLDGRDVLFEVIGRVAYPLADLDGGQTLRRLYQEIMAVEAWWGGEERLKPNLRSRTLILDRRLRPGELNW